MLLLMSQREQLLESMINQEYKEKITIIEQHSWRILSLISMIEHNESFYSKFKNTKEADEAFNKNEEYKEKISILNEQLFEQLKNLKS